MSKSSSFTPSVQNTAFADSSVLLLDALSVKRDAWENGAFKAANEALYGLLADTLDIYNSKFLCGEMNDQRALRKELVLRLKEMGVKTQINSTTLTMLVRFVFKSDRKRAHRYAYVLTAAVKDGIAAADFANYVRNAGGVEEVVRTMAVKEATLQKRAAVKAAEGVVKSEVDYNTLNPLAVINMATEGEYAVLIAKPQPDGTTRIINVLNDANDAVISALMRYIAKQKVANGEADEVNAAETDSFKQALAKNDEQAQLAA